VNSDGDQVAKPDPLPRGGWAPSASRPVVFAAPCRRPEPQRRLELRLCLFGRQVPYLLGNYGMKRRLYQCPTCWATTAWPLLNCDESPVRELNPILRIESPTT
jgi:hypothetical protein